MSSRSDFVGNCESCGRVGHLVPTPSLLDAYDYSICSSCAENHAETWVSIANFMRDSEWRFLDSGIKDIVTVWQDETYRPVLQAAMVMAERQLVVVDPLDDIDPEEEELLLDKMAEVAGSRNYDVPEESDEDLSRVMRHMARTNENKIGLVLIGNL